MKNIKYNTVVTRSTIPTISTKRTITSHLHSLDTKRPQHMTLEIQTLSWDRHKMWQD